MDQLTAKEISFVLLFLFSVGCHAPSETSTTDQTKREIVINGPRDYLGPVGFKAADIMQAAYPPKMLALTRRLQQAQQDDPALFISLISQAQPGEPMPYDERIGLSKSEYDEWLNLSKEISTQKVAEGEIEIARFAAAGPNAFVVDGQGELAKFKQVVINFDRNTVSVPGMTLKEPSDVHADKSMFGAWDGIQWKKMDHSGRAEFSIGVLRDSGRYLMHYEVQRETPTFEVEQFEISVIYD